MRPPSNPFPFPAWRGRSCVIQAWRLCQTGYSRNGAPGPAAHPDASPGNRILRSING
jgi:hypothetical protein